MKKLLIIIGSIIAVILITIGVVLYLTRGATKAADNFFSLIKSGNVDGAYQSLSQQFKEKTTAEQFNVFVKTYSITDFESVFWNSRTINPSVTELEGSIKTKNSKTIPVKVDLVKEDGQWKILSIDVEGGIPQVKTIPSDSDLVKLVNNSIQLFGQAVKSDDFSIFYSSISQLWQAQTTPQGLREAFQSFIDKKIDITILSNITPVFSEKPAIDADGVLILKGRYYYQGYPPINFQVKYIYEYPNWKLIGIKVSI
ncbi:MAG TPA: hypothetical protein VK675_02220 [Candidatus Paceibacterota bacterium]|nr:hypothetical protein [Candidatus Paceibacterota bacterium]